jgi:predicted transcriptional regulator
MTESFLTMAKEHTPAQVEAGHVTPENMMELLHATYATLQHLHSSGQTLPSEAVPQALRDWKKSITKHAVRCLECGASFKQLSSRHLRLHDLDGRSYRDKYGIPRAQSLSARDTLARRREIVQQSKPWEQAPTSQQTHKTVAKQKARGGKKKASATTGRRKSRA